MKVSTPHWASHLFALVKNGTTDPTVNIDKEFIVLYDEREHVWWHGIEGVRAVKALQVFLFYILYHF